MIVPINLKNHLPKIESRIDTIVNGTVEIENGGLLLLPYPRMKLNGFRLTDDNNEEILKADNVVLEFSLWKLLFKELNITTFYINKAQVLVRRDPEGLINFSKLFKKTATDNSETREDPERGVKIRIKDFALRSATVRFIDQGAVKPTELNASEVKANFSLTENGVSYNGAARIGSGTTVQINGSYAKLHGGFHLFGKMQFEDFELGTLKPYLKDDDLKKIAVEGRLSTHVTYEFDGKGPVITNGVLSGKASLSEMNIKLPNILSKPLHSPEGSFTFELNLMKKGAELELNDIDIKLEKFRLSGMLGLDIPKTNIIKATAASLTTSPMDAAYLKELIVFDAAMPTVVKETAEKLGALTGAVAINDLKLLNLSGDAAHLLDKLDFNLELLDLGFSHSSLGRQVTDLNGIISFSKGRLFTAGMSGKYGKGTLHNLMGEMFLDSKIPYGKARIKTTLNAGETLQEWQRLSPKSAILNNVRTSGLVTLDISCKGMRNGLFTMQTLADFTGAEVAYKNSFQKKNNLPLTIKSTFTKNKQSVMTDKTKIQFGSSNLDVDTHYKKQNGAYLVRISSDDLSFYDFASATPYFTEDDTTKGKISLNITRERNDRSERPRYGGELRLENGLFKTKLLARAVRDMDAVVKLNGTEGKITLHNMEVAKSSLSGKIDLVDIEKGIIDYNLFFDYLNPKDFLRPIEKSRKTPPFLTGKGKITATTGVILNKVSFDNLSTGVIMDKKTTLFSPLEFTSHNAIVDGSYERARTVDVPYKFKTNLRISSAKLPGLLRELGVKNRILSGKLTAELDITENRVEEGSPAGAGLNGTAKATAIDGKLWKLLFISKIFSIVNIISIDELFEEGLKYKQITGNFTMKDGVIKSEDIQLDSKSLKMSAVGEIDATKATVDAIIGVHPLVTIDKIISTIPLAGWIIAGEERSTIIMYYKMTGPLKDPDVNALPIKSIGKKVLGIFTRILTSPIKIIEPLVPGVPPGSEGKKKQGTTPETPPEKPAHTPTKSPSPSTPPESPPKGH